MEGIILTVFLGLMPVTSYQPVASQTDSSPTWTSIGDRTTKFGVAVSQDLLKSGRVRYGDVLYIEGVGMRVVNDCMNARHKNRIDILVFTYAEEKRMGTRTLRVWRLYEAEKTKLGGTAGHRRDRHVHEGR